MGCYGRTLLSVNYVRSNTDHQFRSISMKFLLCLMVVAMGNAARIPRSFDAHTQHVFPNLQTVHHGHGATSYQNVQIENHGDVPIPTKLRVPSHHYVYHPEHHDHELQYKISSVTVAPFLNEDDVIGDGYFLSEDDEAHTSNNIEHVEINSIPDPSVSYYDHYDHEYDYGYH